MIKGFQGILAALACLSLTAFTAPRAEALNPYCKDTLLACEATFEGGGRISIYGAGGKLHFQGNGFPITNSNSEMVRDYIDLYAPNQSWTSRYSNAVKVYSNNDPSEVTSVASNLIFWCRVARSRPWWFSSIRILDSYMGDLGNVENALSSWDAFYSANAGYCG